MELTQEFARAVVDGFNALVDYQTKSGSASSKTLVAAKERLGIALNALLAESELPYWERRQSTTDWDGPAYGLKELPQQYDDNLHVASE